MKRRLEEAQIRSSCNCKWELPKEKYETLIRHHIEMVDESLRVPEAVRQERLGLCNACKYQENKMCRMCGCFVEVRTSRRNMYCPLVPPEWDKMPPDGPG